MRTNNSIEAKHAESILDTARSECFSAKEIASRYNGNQHLWTDRPHRVDEHVYITPEMRRDAESRLKQAQIALRDAATAMLPHAIRCRDQKQLRKWGAK